VGRGGAIYLLVCLDILLIACSNKKEDLKRITTPKYDIQIISVKSILSFSHI
jgi:hypothetical protein